MLRSTQELNVSCCELKATHSASQRNLQIVLEVEDVKQDVLQSRYAEDCM
jgi:hypothetical protein